VRAIFAIVLVLTVYGCGTTEAPARPQPMEEASPQVLQQASRAFGTVRDGFLEWYFEAHPVRASDLGLREHDARLPGMDRTAIQRRIDALLDWQAQLQRIPIRFMRGDERMDYAVLEFGIRAELLGLEEVRPWALDPREYTDVIARGVASVVEAGGAPSAERAEALRSRLAGAPVLLDAARTNLRSPPRAWTENGLEHAALLLRYLEDELPAALAADPGWGAALADIEEAREVLVEALRGHIAWLQGELLPASTGQFRLGRYLFARQLLYTEHITLSVEELDRLNEHAIEEHQERMTQAAAELDADRAVAVILDSLFRTRPEPQELVPLATRLMGEARDWTVGAGVVSLPEATLPVARLAPSHARQERTSLSAPGPFGDPAYGSYFNLTPPDEGWTPARRESHLQRFNEAELLAATVHETVPGRYLADQHARAEPNTLRKAFLPRSLTGGWAQYVEQLALDEGLRANDPAARMGQLRRALVAHARWQAVLQVHVAGRDPDQVVERVMSIAYLDEAAARREVDRAVRDPLVLADALGRLQILELRRAYEEHRTEAEEPFSLRDFHDRLLDLALPLPLATEAFMPQPESERPAPQRVRRPRQP
jgi:uncharacterized protein (DUF885 family)